MDTKNIQTAENVIKKIILYPIILAVNTRVYWLEVFMDNSISLFFCISNLEIVDIQIY
jgi:hypothetical protein